MENLSFLGVPILKHIRVYQCYSNNLFEVVSIAQLVDWLVGWLVVLGLTAL